MTEFKNPKADFLWEATRRNEIYKKEYYETLENYKKKYPDQPRSHYKKLPCHEPDRWKIKMGGINPITKKLDFFYWLNPDVKLQEIWDDVLTQNNTWMHPYNHLFPNKKLEQLLRKKIKKNSKKKCGNIFLDSYYYNELHGFEDDGIVQFNNYERISEPQNISDDLMLEDFFEFEADNTVYVAIKRKNTKNKMLFMIDPFDKDENILTQVQKIKDKVIQSLKVKAKILKTEGKVLLEPSKMNSYFDWFKRYDQIIHMANKESHSAVVCINGAKCLNTENDSGIDFGQLVPSSDIGQENFDTGRQYDNAVDKKIRADKKKYKTAYENSVKLIQETPNIFFLPPKIKSKF